MFEPAIAEAVCPWPTVERAGTPVVSLKSVGGASEVLSQQFQIHRCRTGTNTCVDAQQHRPLAVPWFDRGLGRTNRTSLTPYPQEALQTKYTDPVGKRMKFQGGKNEEELPLYKSVKFHSEWLHNLEDREMIVVNVVNPTAGRNVCVAMAEMLTMLGDEEERDIGFAGSDRTRLTEGWNKVCEYQPATPTLNHSIMMIIPSPYGPFGHQSLKQLVFSLRLRVCCEL